jgi:hypothetical protein
VTFFLFLFLLPVLSKAQVFYSVTHLGGTKEIAGNLVTVRHVGYIPNEYTACKMGPYRISNYKKQDTGEDTCRAYVFSFANPVRKARARLTNVNMGEEISIWVNGNFYTLTAANLFPYGGTCVGMPVSSVKNGRVGTDSSNSNAMVEIDPGFGMDSVMVYYDKNDDAGIHFSFEFESDPKLTINKPYNDTLKCVGDSMSVKLLSTALLNGNNIFTVELSDANGSFSNPIVIGSLADSTTLLSIPCKLPDNIVTGTAYRVRVVSSSPYRVSDDNGSNLRITAYPTLNLSSNSPVCEGDDIIFKTNEIAGASYYWSGPGNFYTATPSPVVKSAGMFHNGGYVVSVIDHKCKTIDTIFAQVKPNPVLLSANCNSPLCEGDSLMLNAQSTNVRDTFYWSGPGNFSVTGASYKMRNISSAQSGIYSVSAYYNGCLSDTLSVEAKIKSKPSLPLLATNAPVLPGDELKFTAEFDTTGKTFSWSGPDGFYSNQKDPSILSPTTASQGDYVLTVDQDGCTTSAKVFARILGKDFFTMYPNPNDGNFSIKLNVLENQQIPIEIVNDQGQVVYRETNETKNNILVKDIAINRKLPPGLYILRVGIDKEAKNVKFRIAY